MRVYSVKKVDDATSYTTRKEVEDSCRAMIASYTSDYMVWNQLHESEDGFERSVATQVKIRCNKTAATYNEYVLKNSYVWNGNVPDDISDELAYIP